MSSSPPSQKRSLDDPSDPPSKIRHLLIANDATTERSHVVVNLLYKRDLDLETLTRPLVEQDYADIFCAITVLEAGNNVHRDWMYDGLDKDNRLCLFQRGVAIAGEHFFDALKEASKDRTFKLIRNAAFLREPFPISTWKPAIKAGYHGMRHALREAWNTPYVSDCHNILIEVMTRIKEGEEDECCGPSDFNNTVMIVQSSGTGKSRMVDEAARLVFTIPFNLQSENNLKRYPPPDNDVRKYMCQIWREDILRTRYHAFIFCLCRTIAAELHSIFKGPKIPQAQFASIWRDHLAQKDVRSDLYKIVVDQANQASQSELIGVGVIDANPAAYSMYEKTYPELENLQKTIASKVNDLGGKVDILMYFDEAQELMKAEDSPQDRAYRALRSVLNDYGDCPLFTIFLSTVPHIAEYVAPVITTRVYGHKLGEPKAPITGTPFDCAPDILVAEYAHDREEIAQPHFMARFGRPLFWTTLAQIPVTDHQTIQTFLKKLRSKLINNPKCDILPSEWECKELGKLAVADVRLCLQYEPNLKSFKQKVVEVQAKLVANHMRIAYSFPAHRRYFVSGYPSEPLLAEAAAQQLHHWRKTQPSFLLDIVHHHMKTGLLDRADRGEVVARILILEAYDRAVTETFTPNHNGHVPLFGLGCRLIDWISQLFAHDLALEILHSKPANGATEDQTFEEVFKDAWIRVTHYAQAGDEHVFNAGTHAMFAAFVRGMAFICRDGLGNGGSFVNILIPVLLRDVKIGSSVMSAVFIQFGRRAARVGTYAIIDAEKDFDFFQPEPGRLSEDDRPYVTLIMDLGVRDPLLDHATPQTKVKLTPTKHQVSTDTLPIKHSSRSQSQSRKQKHPRYEIHISGCSNTLYNLIPPASAQLAKYKEILHMPEFLPEHTRKATISQAMEMKPVFVRGKESYAWIGSGVLNPSQGNASDEDEDVDVDVEEGYAIVGGHRHIYSESEEDSSDWDQISRSDVDMPLS